MILWKSKMAIAIIYKREQNADFFHKQLLNVNLTLIFVIINCCHVSSIECSGFKLRGYKLGKTLFTIRCHSKLALLKIVETVIQKVNLQRKSLNQKSKNQCVWYIRLKIYIHIHLYRERVLGRNKIDKSKNNRHSPNIIAIIAIKNRFLCLRLYIYIYTTSY